MVNKPGTHFSSKVVLDGITFDSKKEAEFYQRFIKDCGYRYEIHPRFTLQEADIMRAITYKPDFVVYDENSEIMHVYDVKTSLDGQHGVDAAAKLRFNLFARKFNKFVEVVVPRKHDFKVRIYGLRKNVNSRQVSKKGKVQFYDVMQNVNYKTEVFFE